MQSRIFTSRPRILIVVVLVLFAIMLACARSAPSSNSSSWQVPEGSAPQAVIAGTATSTPFLPATRVPGAPILTPTPDSAHTLPSLRTEPEQYVVQSGDTLGVIAQNYGVSLEEMIAANDLPNPNILEVGQILTVPVPTPQSAGPSFKIIPDSELVYGPTTAYFDLKAFIQGQSGYLTGYHEVVDGSTLTGTQIVERVAQEYSVNPRLLLAVLEYQSNWLTRSDQNQGKIDYPVGVHDSWRKGLYRQLAWAANNLNRGYYLWRVNGIATWVLGDGSVVPIDPSINAGTAGVQHMFASLYDRAGWEQAVSQGGLFETINALFGYPFDLAIEPLLPPGMRQPPMQLPFEPGAVWAFTGGPHGGYDDGSAWAALDFAPSAEPLGCVSSEAWVVATADGLVVRTGNGAVIQDLDGDGFEGTGWVILYMHVESRERVRPGTFLKAGERVGHPSCEGGVSSGTHLHLARRYNGEWIPADQTLPFILDGWVSRGDNQEYDGFLERNGQKIEAWEGRSGDNLIQR